MMTTSVRRSFLRSSEACLLAGVALLTAASSTSASGQLGGSAGAPQPADAGSLPASFVEPLCFTERALLTVGGGTDWFGRAVSVSDGVVLVSARYDERAHVYVPSVGTWIEQATLQGTPGPNGFATSLALDGSTAAVGAPALPIGADGGAVFGPCFGDPSISSVTGVVPGSGATRRYQLYYRDPAGPCGATFNFSNGVEIVW